MSAFPDPEAWPSWPPALDSALSAPRCTWQICGPDEEQNAPDFSVDNGACGVFSSARTMTSCRNGPVRGMRVIRSRKRDGPVRVQQILGDINPDPLSQPVSQPWFLDFDRIGSLKQRGISDGQLRPFGMGDGHESIGIARPLRDRSVGLGASARAKATRCC